MQIPNLNQTSPLSTEKLISIPLVIILVITGITLGYFTSRPASSQKSPGLFSSKNNTPVSADSINSSQDLEVGKLYGNQEKSFKDVAVGVIEKGSINGEGTHILNREGGASQRASLTSSAVDLDLFIGKKVEIKGETNSSNKVAWLLDVGSIKIIE
ncbi:MAG: hypothetical protein WC686_01645 [Candidatus Shapirobacteria bacterium]|jgi:hypothetical protein